MFLSVAQRHWRPIEARSDYFRPTGFVKVLCEYNISILFWGFINLVIVDLLVCVIYNNLYAQSPTFYLLLSVCVLFSVFLRCFSRSFYTE
jgi:uncharacterized membrane protein